jgi:ribosomal protein S18 acetylase RimI-like enzyme
MNHEQTSTLDTVSGREMPSSANPQLASPPKSSAGKSRRMQLLERQGCFTNGTKSVTIQRATSVEDLHAAYQLVYECFVERGFIFPNPSRLRMRPFEALPETATFIAKADNKVVGVTSIVIDTPGLGLPSEKPYPQQVESMRQSARKLGEITNLAIAPDFRRTNILTELIRCYIAHLLAIDADYAIASVNPGHQAFYELLGFDSIGPRTSYSQQFEDPVVLVRLSLGDLMEKLEQVQPADQSDSAVLKNYYLDANPYHCQMEPWIENAHKSFADPVFLRQLFVERSNLLRDCSSGELEVIRQYWSEDLFLNALGHNILYDGFLPCEI